MASHRRLAKGGCGATNQIHSHHLQDGKLPAEREPLGHNAAAFALHDSGSHAVSINTEGNLLQIMRVSDAMAEMGRELSYRLERLEGGAVLQELREQLQAHIDHVLNTQGEQLLRHVDEALGGTIREHGERLRTQEARLQEESEHLQACRKELANQNRQLQAHDEELRSQGTRLRSHENDLHKCREDLRDREAELRVQIRDGSSVLQKELCKYSTSLKGQSEKLCSYKSEVTTLEEAIRTQSDIVRVQGAEVSKHGRELHTMQNRLAAFLESNSQLQPPRADDSQAQAEVQATLPAAEMRSLDLDEEEEAEHSFTPPPPPPSGEPPRLPHGLQPASLSVAPAEADASPSPDTAACRQDHQGSLEQLLVPPSRGESLTTTGRRHLQAALFRSSSSQDQLHLRPTTSSVAQPRSGSIAGESSAGKEADVRISVAAENIQQHAAEGAAASKVGCADPEQPLAPSPRVAARDSREGDGGNNHAAERPTPRCKAAPVQLSVEETCAEGYKGTSCPSVGQEERVQTASICTKLLTHSSDVAMSTRSGTSAGTSADARVASLVIDRNFTGTSAGTSATVADAVEVVRSSTVSSRHASPSPMRTSESYRTVTVTAHASPVPVSVPAVSSTFSTARECRGPTEPVVTAGYLRVGTRGPPQTTALNSGSLCNATSSGTLLGPQAQSLLAQGLCVPPGRATSPSRPCVRSLSPCAAIRSPCGAAPRSASASRSPQAVADVRSMPSLPCSVSPLSATNSRFACPPAALSTAVSLPPPPVLASSAGPSLFGSTGGLSAGRSRRQSGEKHSLL